MVLCVNKKLYNVHCTSTVYYKSKNKLCLDVWMATKMHVYVVVVKHVMKETHEYVSCMPSVSLSLSRPVLCTATARGFIDCSVQRAHAESHQFLHRLEK